MTLPALLGGSPTRPAGPPAWPPDDAELRDAVARAVAEGALGRYRGPYAERLAETLASIWNAGNALLCASGTFAIECALRAAGVKPGDEVAVAALDFPGNFLNVHAVGATPLLVDVDPATACVTAETFAAALGPKTRAALVSHLYGSLAPLPDLMRVARERNVVVIEDACQCPGATLAGRRVGAWGDVGVVSFGGSKLLAAGTGGAMFTARDDLFARASAALVRGSYVAPLAEIQCAALLPQLARLDERRGTRAAAAAWLAALWGPGLTPLTSPEDGGSDYYKLGLRYDAARFGLPRATFVSALRAEGIAFSAGFRAAQVGRSPKRYRAAGPLLGAEQAHAELVTLHHPVLLAGDGALDEVARAIDKIRAHVDALARLALCAATDDE